MATYAIGDVQGCFASLDALVKKIKFNPDKDTLWFTGDLVNRGPDSLKTLQFIYDRKDNIKTVLGNHDLHLLAVASGAFNKKSKDTFDDILHSKQCDVLCDWLRLHPLVYHENDFTLVHAGIPPQWDLQTSLNMSDEISLHLQGNDYQRLLKNSYGDKPDQWNDELTGWERTRMIISYFTRMRFCTEQGRLEFSYKAKPAHPDTHYKPWFEIQNRKMQQQNILFGHWAALEAECNTPHIYPLDGGCVWGGQLMAMRLTDFVKEVV